MKTKRFNFSRVLCLFLVCLILATIVSPAIEVSAASQDTTWRNYYYTNSRGKYCYNRYIYPSKAQSYGIPESYFQKPGTYVKKGNLGSNSYVVITVEDLSGSPVYPANNSNNRYLTSYFMVWVNEVQASTISHVGGKAANNYATIDIKYCSPGISMCATSTPLISVRTKAGNPNLYTRSVGEYNVWKKVTVSWGKIGALVVNTGKNITTSNYASIIKDVISWAVTSISASRNNPSNSQHFLTSTSKFADQYSDSGMNKARSVGLVLNGTKLNQNSHYATLFFDEVHPTDAPSSYNKNATRYGEVRFCYKFTTSSGKSVTYTHTYTFSYKFYK